MRRHLGQFALALGLFGSGCPENAASTPPSKPPTACTAVGQRCEYSPGKLGACVLRDDCKTGNCYVCQSQH